MNEEKIQHYKSLLEAEKKVLETELGGMGIKNPENGDWEAVPNISSGQEFDENDLADRAEEFEERSATLYALEGRLTDIKDALDKIERGIYGICEISGKPIEEERLEANPAARTCIEHKDVLN